MTQTFTRPGMPPIRFLPPGIPRADSGPALLEIAKGATEAIFALNGEILPTFMFDNPGGYTSAMQIPWSNPSEKRAVAFTVRRMFEVLGIKRYAVITEMWFSIARHSKATSVAEALAANATIRPSQDPNRKEGILVVVHDNDQTHAALYVIERPPGGSPRLRLEKDDAPGQFVDMLFAPAPKQSH